MSSSPTPSPRLLRASLAGAVATALALRLPWLGRVPNPAGDEGNWALLALRIAQGHDARLTADAGFVTTLWARLIAAAFRIAGASWTVARFVPVFVTVAAMLSVAYVARRSDRSTAGVVAAWVIAVHPWSVFWSRTVSVPYALSLAVALVTPLALLDALRSVSIPRALMASQLMGLGLQCSPLAAVPCGAVVLHLSVAERTLIATLRTRPSLLVATLSGAAHLLPVLRGALAAMQVDRAHAAASSPGTFAMFSSLATALLGDLSGAATRTHVAGTGAFTSMLGALLAIAVVGCTVREALAHDTLARFAVLHLALAALGLPLMLVPTRAWHMPTIDSDRYGFVLLAPLALCVGVLATSRARLSRALAIAAVFSYAVTTFAIAEHFARGGTRDLGLTTRRGGGRYRGWQRARGDAAIVDRIRDVALREGNDLVITYDDYAFHALRFAIAASGTAQRVSYLMGTHRRAPDARSLYVVWSAGVFDVNYEPRSVREEALALYRRVTQLPGARRLEVLRAPDGSALCEVWRVGTLRP